MRGALLVLMAFVPVLALGEENCGQLVRSATTFRGTVLRVEQREALEVYFVERDPRFVIDLDIERLDGKHEVLRTGSSKGFYIHSPSRTFGAEDPQGKTFELLALSIRCDGEFRRFDELRVRSDVAEELESTLAAGHRYRAEVQRDGEGGLELAVNRIRAPMHHMYRIEWANVKDFPSLLADDERRTIVFDVVAERIWKTPERLEWRTVYEVKIVSIL